MPAAAVPENEGERLAALRATGLLDSPTDPGFDGLVRLAAELNRAPIALMSLVDQDRQWFKSSIGLEMKETPRDLAFCAHAILTPDEVLVVEDATLDSRFADNSLVTGASHMRFYAGAPIRSAAGFALGTLCIIDTEPRIFDSASRRRLSDLARAVSTLVGLCEKASLLHEASTDRLTGLGNRAQFDDQLDGAVAAARDGVPQALILIDLDRFKEVNEKHGYAMGDAVLQAVAARLRQSVRANDQVLRLGGDEFVVLAPDVVSHAAAAALAQRIRQALDEPLHLALPRVRQDGAPASALDLERIPASIGVALCPRDAPDRGGLIRVANLALYRGKRAGSGAGPTRACGDGPDEPGEVGRELKGDLLAALSRDETQLWWQPYLALATDEVAGCEALLRWDRPGYGNVPPATLLPFVEANGLIGPLDEWVLRRACVTAASWSAARLVSVNLSARWFGEEDVEALVCRALAASGLAPGRLCLELTEHTLIVNRAVAQSRIRRLHALGVRLSLDDFGTGSSSLAYLRHYRFDTIKLDRAFVAPLGHDARADAVTRSIIRMGHELGSTICAEGVETQEQLAFLRDEGCDLIQGYLLGRPSPLAMLHGSLGHSRARKPVLGPVLSPAPGPLLSIVKAGRSH